mmetsp:Transcript_67106/g.140166  ORF Transcript_67106/g.140166 Transcript_67106/m.140166 type:complete len:219 (+) Transcript_67106:828-1484(+)
MEFMWSSTASIAASNVPLSSHHVLSKFNISSSTLWVSVCIAKSARVGWAACTRVCWRRDVYSDRAWNSPSFALYFESNSWCWMTKSWTRRSTSTLWLSFWDAAPETTVCSLSAFSVRRANSPFKPSFNWPAEVMSKVLLAESLSARPRSSSARNLSSSRESDAEPEASRRAEATRLCISWKRTSESLRASSTSVRTSSWRRPAAVPDMTSSLSRTRPE